MLYTSTRNVNDTFTAYRALNEETAPDGGMYVPYRMPVLPAEDVAALKQQTTAKTIADILNLLFGMRISEPEVESAIGKYTFEFHEITQNVLFAEMWHTPESSSEYIVKALYRMLTGKTGMPRGWAYTAIEIALLFAAYGSIDQKYKEFDIVVPADDFADVLATLYAKDMGLPIKGVVCVCGNGNIWDLLNKGELDTSMTSLYAECFLYQYICDQDVKSYLDACARNSIYFVDEMYIERLNRIQYVAVVSSGRIDTVISSMYSANGYHIDSGTAFAYGGLQDYRASVGTNERTVILSRKRPERIKE